jgi:hypothetical protein
MLNDALHETEALPSTGTLAQSGLLRAYILFELGKPGDASAALDSRCASRRIRCR